MTARLALEGIVPRRARSLSASEMFLDNGSRWSRFTVQIDIPQTCEAQSLSLVLDAHTASETIISGAWFDELKIKKD